ncbi:Methyl sulfide methyltransferase-associated sensor [uncultured archaeon]|nr:Methyl sulfide methyltransferase-associated sensor [uncultured archaeon]
MNPDKGESSINSRPWSNRFTIRLPLRLVLTLSFVFIILVTVGVTDYLAFKNEQETVNDLVTQLFSEIDARVDQHLDNYLDAPFTINQINLNALREGQLNISDTEKAAQYFWQQGQFFRGFGSMGYASDKGELAAANEPENYMIITSPSPSGIVLRRYAVVDDGRRTGNILHEVQNFDVHARGWYQTAVKAKKPVWTGINPALTSRRLDVTAVTPYYDGEGRLQGVFYLDVSLAQINQFLRDINISRRGQIFIMEPNGLIVASSTSEQPYVIKDDEIKRLNASASSEPLIGLAARHIGGQFTDLGKISGPYQSTFNIQGERHFLHVTPYHDSRGLDWFVVLIVPESDFMAHATANYRNTLFLIAASILLSTIAATLVARRVTRPLSRLSQSATAIAQGDWDQKLEMKRGDEVGELADAFNTMTVRLKENLTSLRESEERFRALVEQAPEAILVRDVDTGLFVDANRNAEKLFGCGREELLKSGPERFYPQSQPDNRPVRESMQEYTARALTGETVTFERTVRNTAGREIICQVWLIRLPSRDCRLIRGSFIDITGRKRAEERLTKLNNCMLGFGPNPFENINRLTALCGELMRAACALYNRLDKGMLCSWGQWNAPPGYNPVDWPEGHICYDTIIRDSDEILVVHDLPGTEYARTDPNVMAYNLKTYVGQAVRFGEDYVGSLCMVYQNDFYPDDEDKKLMGIIASAIAVEEKRRRAEEELREASLYTRSLIEVNLDPLVTINLEGKITDVNKAAELVTGIPREKLIGSDYSGYLTEPEKAKKGFHRVLSQGFVRGYPLTIRHTSGKVTEVLFNASVYKNEAGEVQGVFAAARDITESKRAQEQIELLKHSIDIHYDGAYWMDTGNRFVYVNDAGCKALGYGREELIGKSIGEVNPRATPERMKSVWERLRKEGFFSTESMHHRKDGSEFPVDIMSTYVQFGGKEYNCGFAHDITERKRVDLAMRESETRYRTLFERAGDYVILLEMGKDDMLFIQDMNEAALRAHGYSREDILWRPLSVIDPDSSPEKNKERGSRAGQGGSLLLNVRHRRKDGTMFDVEANTQMVQIGGRRLIISVERDITERKRAVEELKRSKELRETILNSMNHEISIIVVSDFMLIDVNQVVVDRLKM